jgi:hypothetical protein
MKIIVSMPILLSTLIFLAPLKTQAQLNFAPISQHKCTYKENERILVQGICLIYRNHNGYSYSIQWPDGLGTGIDRVTKQTAIIDKQKEAKITLDKNFYYFKWENKLVIISRFPVK